MSGVVGGDVEGGVVGAGELDRGGEERAAARGGLVGSEAIQRVEDREQPVLGCGRGRDYASPYSCADIGATSVLRETDSHGLCSTGDGLHGPAVDRVAPFDGAVPAARKPVTTSRSGNHERTVRGCSHVRAQTGPPNKVIGSYDAEVMSTARGGPGGAIVNVSSSAAALGSAHEYVHYAAAKAGVEAFSVGLAKELADQGVRVNAVAPGMVRTGIHAAAGDPHRLERVLPRIPMGRAGEPEEVASAIAWLLGPHSAYVTGASIRVAGGL